MKSITIGGKSVEPSKIVCIGRNYVGHIEELNNEIPEEAVIFVKPNSSISDDVLAGRDTPIHYEGELCFVVNQNNLSAVGFGLDLTKREVQSQLKTKGLPWERSKCFDGSAVFSDFVAIDGWGSELSNLRMELSINGEIRQQAGYDLMMYKPEVILKEVQQFMTLEDGDVIMTGTPKGVGVLNVGDAFVGKVFSGDDLLVEKSWVVKA